MTRFLRFLILLAVVSVLAAACRGRGDDEGQYSGSGRVTTLARVADDFSGVHFSGSGVLAVRLGDPAAVTITGDDNLLLRVTTEVRGATLHVGMMPGSYQWLHPLRVKISVPHLETIAMRGSATAQVDGVTETRFRLSIQGSGVARVTGKVERLEVRITGSGDLDLDALEADHASVRVTGSGTARVRASQSLDAEVNGSGVIEYRGGPTIEQAVCGSGLIHAIGEGTGF